ncbi:MAG: WecB/TagA/CpsF family glycosyltransferase [Arachnia sp.]
MTGRAPVRELFGYQVTAATLDQAVEICAEAVRSREPLNIAVLNAGKIARADRDPRLREALTSCDITFADGMAVVWASRWLRRRLPERVAGIDLFTRLLEHASREGLRVYLLGAQPKVLALVRQQVATGYPGAVVVGARDGYFADAEAAQVAAEIGRSTPDLLFIAMTSPRKETFIASHRRHLGRIPVVHGVGGSFDVLAGVTKRAPEAWQRLGMEWAYRVLQEPRRMFWRYLVTNAQFARLLARELVAGWRARGERPPQQRVRQ